MFDLTPYEKKIYSQNGEDGIIDKIFHLITTGSKFFVEIGAGDGSENNTRYLKENGWKGIQIDSDGPLPGIIQEKVTAENINKILKTHDVPQDLDLLSLDIDGNDLWVWLACRYNPRVVVIEFNGSVGPVDSKVMPYDPDHRWNGTDYYGASLAALVKVGKQKGMTLVYVEQAGINAFFIQNTILKYLGWKPLPPEELYKKWPNDFKWPEDKRKLVEY